MKTDILKSSIIKKNKLLQLKESSQTFNLLVNILENAKVIYTPDNFNFQTFAGKIDKHLREEQKLSTKVKELPDNILQIEYTPEKGIKKTLGMTGVYHLFISQFENQFLYQIKPVSWIDEPEKKAALIDISALIKDSFEKEITEFVEQNILNESLNLQGKQELIQENCFIEFIPRAFQIVLFNMLEPDEEILVNLNVSELKKHKNIELLKQKLNLKYAITGKSALLFGFDDKDELCLLEDLSTIPLSVKSEIGRDPVQAGEIIWLTTRNNDKQFKEIENLTTFAENDRIRQLVGLSFAAEESKTSENLLKKLIVRDKNPFDEFSIFYLNFSRIKDIVSFKEDSEKLKELFNNVIQHPNAGEELVKWTNTWKLSPEKKAGVLQMFIESSQNTEQYIKILPFHRAIRTEFLKEHNNEVNIFLFDLKFAEHLISANEKAEAVSVLENLLNSVPDDTILELLPNETTDFVNKKNGQLLKVSILELLSQAKNNSPEYRNKLAQLQPFSKERLTEISQQNENEQSAHAQELLNLLENQNLKAESYLPSESTYSTVPPKMFETFLRHPASRETGILYSIQKWISKIEIPDRTIVKSFSETLNQTNYPECYNTAKSIASVFGLDKTELYLARGEKSEGIVGFEANPSFMLIGHKHLDPQSNSFLKLPELEFALGCEFAHLYFKHSRITSDDLWRGAIEKSYLFVETLVNVMPVTGLVCKSVLDIKKFKSISEIFSKSIDVNNLVSKASKITELYTSYDKLNSKEEKELTLVAVSRLMQLTADRAGLMFCNNITAAIRGIFLCSTNYLPLLQEAEKLGLAEFLNQRNNDGKLKYLELNIRISSLFSFYLSQEYLELRRVLVKKST